MLILDRTLPPQIKPISDFTLKKARKHSLDNGLNVFTLNAGEQAVLQLQLLFKAGKSYEKLKGSAFFTAKMLLEGTKSFSSSAISNRFDSMGAFKEISAGFEYATIEVYLLERFLEEVGNLLSSVLSEATFPLKELETTKGISAQQLLVNQQKNNYVSGTAFRENFFGESSPYGYKLTQDIIQSVGQKELIEFYNQHYKSSPFEIILSGKIEDHHLDILNKTLGQLQISPNLPSASPLNLKEFKAEQIYLEKEDALQTSIKIGTPLPSLHHPDRYAIEVLNEALGGYFGSRLMKNIREEKGLTYGIYSTTVNLKPTSYFVINADVQKEKRPLALDEIYKEIELLRTELMSVEELELVKYYMASSYMRSINTPIAISEYFKLIHIHNLSEDFFDSYVSEIQKVTAEEIKKAAQEYLKLPLLEVTVG